MNGKYLERFGKTWGTKAKHATARGAGVKRPVTTISCIKILSNWLNEAKNSCVLRLLISALWGQHEAPLDFLASLAVRYLEKERGLAGDDPHAISAKAAVIPPS